MRYEVERAAEGGPWTPGVGGYLPALDGLRGIAILLVIVSHYLGPYWPAATVGWTGVNLFFVLSGFLITGILLDTKGTPRYFRNFYARRTLRIFPLYYLCLALIFGLGTVVPALNTEGFRAVARHQGWLWLYGMNFLVGFRAVVGGANPFAGDWVQTLHFWSLAVEEQFYLLWPAVVVLCSRRALTRVTVGCFVAAWAFRAYFVLVADNLTAPYFLMPCRMDDLAVGAFVAIVSRRAGGLRTLASCAPWVMVAALWVLLGAGITQRHFFQLDGYVQVVCYTPFAVLYGCVLVFALTLPRSNRFVRVIQWPALRSYGKYSYAIYILHWGLSGLLFARIVPLEALTERLGSEDAALAVRVVVVALVSYVLAAASWHLFEKHFLRLKRYFYASPPGTVGPGAQP